MANIISLDLLQEKYHITFDSSIANSFIVTLSEHQTIRFERLEPGLHIHKVNSVSPYSFLNAVSENKLFYTRREVMQAERAQEQH